MSNERDWRRRSGFGYRRCCCLVDDPEKTLPISRDRFSPLLEDETSESFDVVDDGFGAHATTGFAASKQAAAFTERARDTTREPEPWIDVVRRVKPQLKASRRFEAWAKGVPTGVATKPATVGTVLAAGSAIGPGKVVKYGLCTTSSPTSTTSRISNCCCSLEATSKGDVDAHSMASSVTSVGPPVMYGP